ncbi:protein of unknown function [Candidatus Methylomirabilis oxygeniifera]|uniref:Uncharacterized protein n=1 Tax=Methylomirabilis oxygeniifera TaxID=671143 RepID=D5MHI0_METO1|nr:protein of unknown function [Candidatus Methylomirabilis oxyfera]
MIIVSVQENLQFVEKPVKLLLEFCVFHVVSFSGYETLNLLDFIQRQINPNTFAINNRNFRKIGVAERLIANKVAFPNGEFDR